MWEPIGPDNIGEYLAAFADGELDAAQTLAVLNYLHGRPELLEALRTQQRLRVAAERAIRVSSPPVPDEVRRRIEAMAVAQPPAAAAAPWRRRWVMPAVAAALLVGGVLAGRFAFPPRTKPPVVATADVVPPTLVAHASRVHADCSRLGGAMHTAGFPTELGGLAALVKSDLNSQDAHPDLSPIGFEFIGAGPCAAPLAGTAHLLYRSTTPGHPRWMSVFVQPFSGQFALDQGKIYDLSGPRSPFPVLAWRTGRVVYFLIGDDPDATDRGRTNLAATLRL